MVWQSPVYCKNSLDNRQRWSPVFSNRKMKEALADVLEQEEKQMDKHIEVIGIDHKI